MYAHRKPLRPRQPVSPFRRRRWWWAVPLSLLGLCVLGNLILLVVYANRTYPGTTIMSINVGNTPFDKLTDKVVSLDAVPDTITVHHGSKQVRLNVADSGLIYDPTAERIVRSARQQRSLIPMVNLWSPRRITAPFIFDQTKIEAAAKKLDATLATEPTEPTISLVNGHAVLTPGKPGGKVTLDELSSTLYSAITYGKTNATAVMTRIAPTRADRLAGQQQLLERQLGTTLAFEIGTTTHKPTRTTIASWYEATAENTFTLSTHRIQAYLQEVARKQGTGIQTADAATNAAASLNKSTTAVIRVSAAPLSKTLSYCIAARGVAPSELTALRSKLRDTYSDYRGWSLDGSVGFKEVPSGCDFTVWLTAADQMPSFGAICDSLWSCRVGPNVVINYERWQHASPAWNEFGGSLEDYRHMVINHETGHWLGFGHATCPGKGQLAPVMQQQSISLQGCTFSPWPSAGERATNRTRLGL